MVGAPVNDNCSCAEAPVTSYSKIIEIIFTAHQRKEREEIRPASMAALAVQQQQELGDANGHAHAHDGEQASWEVLLSENALAFFDACASAASYVALL